MTIHAERAFFERLLPTGNSRAIVNCFQALPNPWSQIDFPVALVISHYLYTISSYQYIRKLEKGFQKKPIVAFTNSTVFILDCNI